MKIKRDKIYWNILFLQINVPLKSILIQCYDDATTVGHTSHGPWQRRQTCVQIVGAHCAPSAQEDSRIIVRIRPNDVMPYIISLYAVIYM